MGQEDNLEIENARLRKLLVQAGVDAAASDVASKLQKLLIAELHHRVKNLLSMVHSITSQTLRSASSLEDASEAIGNRIGILGRSFDILIEQNMDAARLATIIETAAEPYNEQKRIAVSVPTIYVAAQPALSFALVFNELSTNATKYGALSQEGGKVEVTGAVDDKDLEVVWTEKDGPPAQMPASTSFGMKMIRSVIAESTVELDFPPTGLVCRISVPKASLRP